MNSENAGVESMAGRIFNTGKENCIGLYLGAGARSSLYGMVCLFIELHRRRKD